MLSWVKDFEHCYLLADDFDAVATEFSQKAVYAKAGSAHLQMPWNAFTV